jgi:hypothetical protein
MAEVDAPRIGRADDVARIVDVPRHGPGPVRQSGQGDHAPVIGEQEGSPARRPHRPAHHVAVGVDGPGHAAGVAGQGPQVLDDVTGLRRCRPDGAKAESEHEDEDDRHARERHDSRPCSLLH